MIDDALAVERAIEEPAILTIASHRFLRRQSRRHGGRGIDTLGDHPSDLSSIVVDHAHPLMLGKQRHLRGRCPLEPTDNGVLANHIP